MQPHRLEALASFLVLDYLEKEGISPQLRTSLAEEFSQKGLFQSLINSNGEPKLAKHAELVSQIPPSNQPVLKNVLYNQCRIQRQREILKNQRQFIKDYVHKKYDIFDRRSRRNRLQRKNGGRRGYIAPLDFPSEMFTSYWTKLKSIFGHTRKDPDPEDPINGSPVYNLSYDKTGKYVVSGADDGLIKIWSTTNGELVNTLIGHDADINATALSECGKYLASCSNHGIVRVWELETGQPVAVFNDHKGIVCSLNFFRIPAENKHDKFQSGLASASDDGTVKIYFEQDFVHNKGVYKADQKHFTLKIEDLNTTSKGFSSIEFHPDGYMAAGTSGGSIIIWNKLLEIDPNQIEKHRIIKNEHSKDCHLTLWNKDGTKLLSASFDGTAKVWPWNAKDFNSNRDMKTMFVFEGDLGKGVDIKCCAVAWSCNGRYAITSFCKKVAKRGDDNPLLQANIQIYDSAENKRAHKFDKTYDGKNLENYIFILEPHPFNDSILMSADYDGKVIIWNIELGIMLNCFIENCSHVGLPLLEAPILDGRFSPDGMNFCIATYYGSITLYGYGEKDMFLTTPTQQFYRKEFTQFEIDSETFRVIAMDGGIDMHLLDNGPLCSADKKEYPKESNWPDDYLDFDEKAHYKKYLEFKALEKLRHEGKQEIEGINSRDCLKALKNRIPEIIQLEIKKLFRSLGIRRSLRESSTEVPVSKIDVLLPKPNELALDGPNERIQRNPATNPLAVTTAPQQTQNEEGASRKMQVEDDKTQELIQRLLLEDSDYDPPSDEEKKQASANRGNARKKRGRKSRAEREEMMQQEKMVEEEETLFKMKDDLAMEEDEELTIRGRRSGQRRTNRLLLDDEEEERKREESDKEEEQARRGERRRRLQHIQVREDPQRRNRGLIEEASRNRLREVNSRISSHQEARENGRERRETPYNQHIGRLIRSRHQNEATEEYLCSRCGLENAKVKCSDGCSRVFHTGCSKRQGRENDGTFTCFPCIYKRKKKEKLRNIQVQRDWATVTTQNSKIFLPQVGDLVTYIPQAHEEFIMQNFDFLKFSKGEVFPLEKLRCLMKDNVCLIKSITYKFPLNPRKSALTAHILAKITLEVIEPEEANGNTFALYFFPFKDDFIIPREYYLNSIKHAEGLAKENSIIIQHNKEEKPSFLSDKMPREVGPFSESHWHSLVLFDHSEEGGYGLRRSRRDDKNMFYASPWDILQGEEKKKLSIDENLTSEFLDKLTEDINVLCAKKTDVSEPFLTEIDKKELPDYPRQIPLEMNIFIITSRLKERFYRHKEAIISDVELIKSNCERFNGEGTEISKFAAQLTQDIIQIINGELDVNQLAILNTSPVKTRSRRRLSSLGEDDSHKKEDNRDVQKASDSEVTRSLFHQHKGHEEHNEEANGILRKVSHEKNGNAKVHSETSRKESSTDKNSQRQKLRPTRRSEMQVEETGTQEVYKTRLRTRPGTKPEEESIGKSEPIHLSREDRLKRRLKARGEFSLPESNENKKEEAIKEIHDDLNHKVHVTRQKSSQESTKLEASIDSNQSLEKELDRPDKKPQKPKHKDEIVNDKKGKNTIKLSNSRAKLLRKTDTMIQRNELELREGEKELSDSSQSVGERSKRVKERGYKTKLRNTRKTYTQYFNTGSSEEDEEEDEDLGEADVSIQDMDRSESVGEERNGSKDENKEDWDEWGDHEKLPNKVRIVDKNEQAQNGEQIQVRRYNTRHRDKI